MGCRRSAWRVVVPITLALTLVTARSAFAEPVTVTAVGASFSAENDTVTLFPTTSSVDVDFSSPIPTAFELQDGTLHVDFSPSVSPPYEFSLSRLITIGGVSRMVEQAGLLSITPSIDTLTLFGSDAILYDLGESGRLFLTIGGLTQTATVIGNFPFTVNATLSPAPLPEPTTLILLGTGIAGMMGRSLRRSKRPPRRP